MRNSYWDSAILALEWQNNSLTENNASLGGVINRKKGWNMLIRSAAVGSMNGLLKKTFTDDCTVFATSAARFIWSATNSDTGASGSIGTGDFTLSTYIIPNFFTAGVNNNIFQIGNAATGFILFRRTSSGDAIAYGTNASSATAACSSSMSTGTKYHLAIVRSGTTLTVYIDGVSVVSVTTAVNIVDNILWVGGDFQTTTAYQIYFFQLAFFNSALWTSNFTPPTNRFFEYSNTLACTLHETLTTSSFLAVGIEAESGLMCGSQTITTTGTDTSFTFTHGASEHFYVFIIPNEISTTIVLNSFYFVDDYGIGLNSDGSRVIMKCTTSGSVVTLPATWPTTGTYNAGGAIFTYIRPYHPGQILGPFPR